MGNTRNRGASFIRAPLTVNLTLRRRQGGPLRRLIHSLQNWHVHSDWYDLVRNGAGQLTHFISFAELQRQVMKHGYSKQGIVVATLHHLDKMRKHKSLVNVFDLCDAVCVVSHQWRKHLIKVEGLDPQKVKVIYNGYLDQDIYGDQLNSPKPIFPLPASRKAELREELGIPQDAFVVGHQGREKEWRKDCGTFFQALDLLGDSVYPLFLEDCSYGRGYKNVSCIGYRRYNDIYAVMDLYGISSVREGGPVGYIEAVQAGIPVVSTRVGMAIDFNPDQYLCDTEDYRSLADIIFYVKKNYASVKEQFSTIREETKWLTWEAIAHQYHSLYRELLCQE